MQYAKSLPWDRTIVSSIQNRWFFYHDSFQVDPKLQTLAQYTVRSNPFQMYIIKAY